MSTEKTKQDRAVRLRTLLVAGLTLISVVPVLVLGVWVQHTVLEKEIEAVREKHLLLAHNLTDALDRYVRDVEAVFRFTVESTLTTRCLVSRPCCARCISATSALSRARVR